MTAKVTALNSIYLIVVLLQIKDVDEVLERREWLFSSAVDPYMFTNV